jgi:hypothetical protein
MAAIVPRSIETSSGRFVDPLDADPADIVLEDIAHALANICRFGGHVKRHYSVAEHSINVARLLSDWGYGPHVALHGLMHDAAEAYLGDVVSPIKYDLFGSKYEAAECGLMLRIAERFGFTGSFSNGNDRDRVREADQVLLWCEVSELCAGGGKNWTHYDRVGRPLIENNAVTIVRIRTGGVPYQFIKNAFLQVFGQIATEISRSVESGAK